MKSVVPLFSMYFSSCRSSSFMNFMRKWCYEASVVVTRGQLVSVMATDGRTDVECCFFIINSGKMNQCCSLCNLVKTFLIILEPWRRRNGDRRIVEGLGDGERKIGRQPFALWTLKKKIETLKEVWKMLTIIFWRIFKTYIPIFWI
jgi:hypothetical protein